MSAKIDRPIVSWLIVTTLNRHRWWKRLVEFLEDDFPAEHAECIILGRQDKNFAKSAKAIGQAVAESISFLPGIAEKWNRVRFIDDYDDSFNFSESLNILLKEARGDVLIYRDADVALTQYGFTRFALKKLMQSRVGLLSFPSVNNGIPFKPEPNLPCKLDPRPKYGENILLVPSANGMATVGLKSIAEAVGGRNAALARWGDGTGFCTKLARAGFLIGYTQPDYWLATADDESPISLTDVKRNPGSQLEKCVGIAMINDFYKITSGDIFWDAYRARYGVHDEERSIEVINKLKGLYREFMDYQSLRPGQELYNFKPWECLSHPMTEEYIAKAYKRAEPFFSPVEKRLHLLETTYLEPQPLMAGSRS